MNRQHKKTYLLMELKIFINMPFGVWRKLKLCSQNTNTLPVATSNNSRPEILFIAQTQWELFTNPLAKNVSWKSQALPSYFLCSSSWYLWSVWIIFVKRWLARKLRILCGPLEHLIFDTSFELLRISFVYYLRSRLPLMMVATALFTHCQWKKSATSLVWVERMVFKKNRIPNSDGSRKR